MDTLSTAGSTSQPLKKRSIGLLGLCSISLAGSAPIIFILSPMITTQGTASIALMLACVIISALAIPCYAELVLMYPNKEGGICGVLSDAFRRYNPIISNLAGTFYWWAWFSGSSFAATLVGTVLKQLFPALTFSVPMIATAVIAICWLLSFKGMRLVTRLLVPFAAIAIGLGILSAFTPVYTGHVNWTAVFQMSLKTTFDGTFGQFTSVMAGIFFLAYAIPSYETVTVYVAETKNPAKNVIRAMYFGAILTALFYVVVPIVWLAALGPAALAEPATPISPTLAPLFGPTATIVAGIFFLTIGVVNCFAALNNCPRTLAQLAEDGLMPEFFAWRNSAGVPWVASLITGAAAIAVIWINAPSWFVAATSFEYVLCLVFAIVAVCLLRRDAPDLPRLYRAPRGSIALGLVAASAWLIATIFGFQQFGLSTMIAGIAFAFSGLLFYFWRKITDRKQQGLPIIPHTLHLKLSGTFVAVLVLDATGYLIAVNSISKEHVQLIVILEDIFVIVALLTLTIGFVLPGMIANAAEEIANAAKHLVSGTLRDFSKAMVALGKGDLAAAHAKIDITPVNINSRDEIGAMAHEFNKMQDEIKQAAIGLENARNGLEKARNDLNEVNKNLEQRVSERTQKLADTNKQLTETLENLQKAQVQLIEAEKLASLGGMVAGIAHEVNTPLGIGITAISYFNDKLTAINQELKGSQLNPEKFTAFLEAAEKTAKIIGVNLERAASLIASFKQTSADNTTETSRTINLRTYLNDILLSVHPIIKKANFAVELRCAEHLEITTYPGVLFQTITILINNSFMHGYSDKSSGNLIIDVQTTDDTVTITYADDGKGIAPELRKKIFEPFFTTSRNQGGVGLGLFVAYNKITQLMKGTIECVEPATGKGACFVITIPNK